MKMAWRRQITSVERRHTTMIVGPTGGGKTVVLDTLKAARLKAEGVVVKYYVINPKAQPLNELYGVMDPVTRDWTDGAISASLEVPSM